MKNTSYRYWMIYVIAIVAAMGGLLFGFDTGVIFGAIPFFQKDFGIDDSMVRWLLPPVCWELFWERCVVVN